MRLNNCTREKIKNDSYHVFHPSPSIKDKRNYPGFCHGRKTQRLFKKEVGWEVSP